MRASSVTARLRTALLVRDWAWWRLPWLLRLYVGAVPAAALALTVAAGASTTWSPGDVVKFLLLLACGAISVVATPRVAYLQAGLVRDFRLWPSRRPRAPPLRFKSPRLPPASMPRT